MSTTGRCAATTCSVQVEIRGFGVLNPIDIKLLTDPEQVVGTLIPDSTMAAQGVFTFARPTKPAGYAVVAATGDYDGYLAISYGPATLRVP